MNGIVSAAAVATATAIPNESIAGAPTVSQAAALTATSAIAQSQDDGALLQLEEQIFEAHEAEAANDDEIIRLFNIFDPEWRRLRAEIDAGRLTMTSDEFLAHMNRIPECREHTRLVLSKRSIFRKWYDLMQQMEAITRADAGRATGKILCPPQFQGGR